MNEEALNRLQDRLGVRFKDFKRLHRALTHRSIAMDSPLDSNERLEFLGDAVVGMVVCENLYRLFPQYSEGDLAKSKAYIVSEAALADAALAMGLEEFVLMSASEAASGGRRRRSILSDAFEALIAAVYLDCGIVAVRRVVRNALMEAILMVAGDERRRDYKSYLQEQTQARRRKTPVYRIVSEVGQEHDKTFTAQVILGSEVIGEGSGKSKKEAEQEAARAALDRLDVNLPGAENPALVTDTLDSDADKSAVSTALEIKPEE